MRDGKRAWVVYEELDYHEEDFVELGESFAAAGRERMAKIGAGIGRLVPVREIVDYGVRWLSEHRRHA